MILIKEPNHIFGMAVVNLFKPFLGNEKFQRKLKKWKKVIIIKLIDLYPFSIIFNDGEISVEYGENSKYDLKLVLSFDTFIEIAEGQVGIISSFLKGKIKVKKLYKVFTVLKFISILIPALKKATEKSLDEGFYKVF